jgi:hypothetical protein
LLVQDSCPKSRYISGDAQFPPAAAAAAGRRLASATDALHIKRYGEAAAKQSPTKRRRVSAARSPFPRFLRIMANVRFASANGEDPGSIPNMQAALAAMHVLTRESSLRQMQQFTNLDILSWDAWVPGLRPPGSTLPTGSGGSGSGVDRDNSPPMFLPLGQQVGDSADHSRAVALGIGVGVGIAACASIILGLAVYLLRRRKKREDARTAGREGIGGPGGPSAAAAVRATVILADEGSFRQEGSQVWDAGMAVQQEVVERAYEAQETIARDARLEMFFDRADLTINPLAETGGELATYTEDHKQNEGPAARSQQ